VLRASATAKLNSTSLLAPGGGAVGFLVEQPGLSLSLLGILLTLLHRAFHLWEFASFLLWVLGCIRGACTWCKKRLCRNSPAVENWERLVGSEEFFDKEENFRHDRAVTLSWKWWNQLSVALRNPAVGAAATWADWAWFGNRIRRHRWHLARNRRR